MVFVLSQTLSGDLTYSEIIVGIVIALILVSLWQRAIENWLFETLRIDRKSTFQTLIVAVAFTAVFFIFINAISSIARDVVLGVSKTTAALSSTGRMVGEREIVAEPATQDCIIDSSLKAPDYVLLGDTRTNERDRRRRQRRLRG